MVQGDRAAVGLAGLEFGRADQESGTTPSLAAAGNPLVVATIVVAQRQEATGQDAEFHKYVERDGEVPWKIDAPPSAANGG
jgi:hypothetical protein